MTEKIPEDKKPEQPYGMWQGAHYALIILTAVVLILMFIAWAMPAATPRPQTTLTVTLTTEVTGTPIQATMQPTTIPEPTSEDVGYADGIIILSAVLSIILLLATLREILYYRRKAKSDEIKQ
jgi:hypothetical protein